MIKINEYQKIIKAFLTKATDKTVESIAYIALQRLKSMPLEDYLQNPLICYNGGHSGNLRHDCMTVARFGELLPFARDTHRKHAELIECYKIMKTVTEEAEKERIERLGNAKFKHLFKYHLLPYLDGNYYHWNIDLDHIYDRFTNQNLSGISVEQLRKDLCVVYAERSATCGIYALVAADPTRMDIDNQIFPLPTSCQHIAKDTCQDSITQLRYLCGRDEQWQPHPVVYCNNYVHTEVKKEGDNAGTGRAPKRKMTASGLNTNILKGTVADLLYEGAAVEDGIFTYSQETALFDGIERYNYTHSDLEQIPRTNGSGWANVKYTEEPPQPRLQDRIDLDYQYLNEAIKDGAITLGKGKIYIVPTGVGKSYAVAKMTTTSNVFLTTRLGLIDEFRKNAGGWERLYSTTVIVEGKNYYGTAQGITYQQIEALKDWDYTFHLDEMHTLFEFDDLREKLNRILAKDYNIIGYTASATEQLLVWAKINDYEMIDCHFHRKKQVLNLALFRYQHIATNLLTNLTDYIQSIVDKDAKVVLYLNDKENIERIAQALPTDKSFTYYSSELKDKVARQEWEDLNRFHLEKFKRKAGGAVLLCTSKLGLGANFHGVVNVFVVFSNDPDGIQQILARERNNDVSALIFSKTFCGHYLMHDGGWQNVLSDYYRGAVRTHKSNVQKDRVFTKAHSIDIKELVTNIYDTYSEVFFNNLFYILQENWEVVNGRNNGNRVFEIANFATETDKTIVSNAERIYSGLLRYIRWENTEKDLPTLLANFGFAGFDDYLSPLRNDRYVAHFVEQYNDKKDEMGLPPLQSVCGMKKEDVLKLIRQVQRKCKPNNGKVKAWSVIKEVLKEMRLTEFFTNIAVEQIYQEVNRKHPVEKTTLKTMLKQRYRYDSDSQCWVKKTRNRRSATTIQKEENDKRLLEQLDGQRITTKTVQKAMTILQIDGNAETVAKRLKRKTT